MNESPQTLLRPSWRVQLAVVAIVLLSAVFRLADLDLVRHSYDDSYPMYDALRMVAEHRPLLVGQNSSVFLANPPLMSYLQAVPYLLGHAPWVVYLSIIALNIIAAWFVYLLTRRLLGNTSALLAALLYAINPWMVYFSRSTWPPALMPFFVALIALELWPALLAPQRSTRQWVWSALATTTMMLTSIWAWGLLAAAAPLALRVRRRIPRHALYGALAILLLCVLGYGATILLGPRGENSSTLRSFLFGGGWRFTNEGYLHALRFVTGRDFEAVYSDIPNSAYPLRRQLTQGVHLFLVAAVAAGMARAGMALWRGPRRGLAVILLVWFFAPIALTTVAKFPVHPHYLLISCPAGHLLAAWGLTPPSRGPLRRAANGALVAFAIGLIALWGANVYYANRAVALSPTGARFEDWALGEGSQVGAAIRALTAEQDYACTIATEGNPVVLSSLSGKLVRTVHELDYPDYVVLPGSEPLLYILENAEASPGVLGPKEVLRPELDMVISPDQRISFSMVEPYSREEALALPQSRVDWGSQAGLAFLGYTLETPVRPGQPLEITTYWRVEEIREETHLWYVGAFYHLMSPGNQMIGNVSGGGRWGYYWRVGDVHVDHVSVPVPTDAAPGEYRLELGLFDTIHAKNYALVTPQGELYAALLPVYVEKP